MRNDAGFTVLEFMVASLILMVGLLGMLNGVMIAGQRSLETSLRNEAITLADEQMTQELAQGFGGLAVASTKNPTPRTVLGVQKSYSTAINVVAPTANTKQIDITVTWSYRGTPKSHSISSAISQPS